MKIEQAQEFWSTYLPLMIKRGAKNTVENPGVEFTKRARRGDFDEISDIEYYERLNAVEELGSFWKGTLRTPAGSVFLEALGNTALSNEDIKEMVSILAEASERTTYHYERRTAPKMAAVQKKTQKQTQKQTQKKMQKEIEDDFEPVFEETPFDEKAFAWTPRLIYDYLNQYVYGQQEAKRAAAIMLYNHLKGRRRNMLMAGPTGCGKTEIWRTLQKKFPFVKIINGPQLACDGWRGSYHIKDIFLEEKYDDARKLLVVIDEADKLFEPSVGAGGTDFSRKIQNELLKIMDGDSVTFNVEDGTKGSMKVDCSNVSFVFCGSFETLLQNRSQKPTTIGFSADGAQKEKQESKNLVITEEDLIRYGNIRREIAGRIVQIVAVAQLEEKDFEAILNSNKKMSPIRQLENLYDIRMLLDGRTRKQLARRAAETNLGCRYIRSKLQSMLDEEMFDEPEQKEYRLSLPSGECFMEAV